MAKWMVAAKAADFAAWSDAFGIDPVVARIIRNRDVTTPEEVEQFLHVGTEGLHSPWLLFGMETAVELIRTKIKEQCKLRIIGDYDIDGICAAYILKRGLDYLGAKADSAIPHRQKDGYGLSNGLIEQAAADGVETIITCDNGIAAAEQIAYANTLGMSVIVTDHHEVPYEEDGMGGRLELLPEAAVVIDPKQRQCTYPDPNICGAVVAYKLIEALLERMEKEESGSGGKCGNASLLQELLGFAAFATIGDVMELRGENRILVREGLKQLQKTSNAGLKALIEVNGLEEKRLSPYHIGYVLGPCLNASGRLDTAARALELLEMKDARKAAAVAGELKAMNDSRKDMTAKGVEEACHKIDTESFGQDRVLVVYLPDCHESLAGIIAGRVRERYGRPVFVLTGAEEGIKGSGRSIEAFHMYEHLSACKELFTRFGGHKLAAGLSMEEDKLEEFRRRINENCGLTEEDFEETVHIDVPMPLSYVSEKLIRQLSCLEPFGPGNPRPLFAQKGVWFVTGRILGKNQNVGKYTVEDEAGKRYEMIYFGNLEKFNRFLEEKYGEQAVKALYEAKGGVGRTMEVTVAYYPDLNEYKGRVSIQYVLQHYC